MVMGMATRPLPTISPLPVLIKSTDAYPLDGAGTLFTTKGTEVTGLHVVTREEAFSHLDKWKRPHPELWRLVGGVATLQRAQREKDWMLFQSALDLVQLWVPHFGGDAEIRHIRGSNNWKEAGWTYSGLMSNLLQTARFIIWYSPKDNRLRPGLFCPDWKVATYAVVGMNHIRICKKPGCGAPFIPSPKAPKDGSKNVQAYCSPEHGNAERVARWKKLHPADKPKRKARKKSLR